MRLRLKVNFAFVIIFGIGLIITTALSFAAEFQQAQERILHDAEVLLSIVLSTRSYTVQQVRPLLAEQNEATFLPQTVPSYAAQVPPEDRWKAILHVRSLQEQVLSAGMTSTD